MSNPILNGKKPLSAKPVVSNPIASTDDIFGNALALGSELKKELEDQGLEARFINAKQLYSFQGYHPKGWVPYKRKNHATMDKVEFALGTDPNGIIRRGDCILAVKSVAEANRYRQFIADKNARQKGYVKSAAEQLRTVAGGKAKIIEGYESNGDDSDE